MHLEGEKSLRSMIIWDIDFYGVFLEYEVEHHLQD